MLITQLYFKMKDLFAITNKTKMPRFNNTGMYGAYTHLMQFFAFNFKKRIISNRGIFIEPVKWKTNRFEPGMICISYSKIFMNFPFKFFKYKVVF